MIVEEVLFLLIVVDVRLGFLDENKEKNLRIRALILGSDAVER